MDQIVERALRETITNIGQLGSVAIHALNGAVKAGVLVRDRGGPFPALKTVWAAPGYDFAGERAKAEAEMQRAARIDFAAYTLRVARARAGLPSSMGESRLANKRKSYQRNNITVRWSARVQVWRCFAPDGRMLEEFQNLKAALDWAKNTTDFLQR